MRQPVSPKATMRPGLSLGSGRAWPFEDADVAVCEIAYSQAGLNPAGTGRRSFLACGAPSTWTSGQLFGSSTTTRAITSPLGPSSTHTGVRFAALSGIVKAKKIRRRMRELLLRRVFVERLSHHVVQVL